MILRLNVHWPKEENTESPISGRGEKKRAN